MHVDSCDIHDARELRVYVTLGERVMHEFFILAMVVLLGLGVSVPSGLWLIEVGCDVLKESKHTEGDKVFYSRIGSLVFFLFVCGIVTGLATGFITG